jgi:hypothetical protein
VADPGLTVIGTTGAPAMRRLLVAFASAAALAAVIAFPAAASEMCASGRAFGEMHAMEAREGALGGEMNPGMHRGFSTCR